MFNIQSILGRCVLALAFLTGSAAAVAGPTYHVDIDSASQAGDGYLILTFLNSAPQPALASATITNWSGAFLGTGAPYNEAAIDFANEVLTVAAGTNGYLFDVSFGGAFGFDVSFDSDNVAFETIFGAALADAEGNYVGDGDLANIVLGTSGPAQVSANAAYASVTEQVADVPEPAEWALMLTGLGLMGFSLRRRVR